uniref:Putative secreted protein n=1 Tax=Psorophora albipes TaxID=869069 RepID=T1E2Q3_9DIPT
MVQIFHTIAVLSSSRLLQTAAQRLRTDTTTLAANWWSLRRRLRRLKNSQPGHPNHRLPQIPNRRRTEHTRLMCECARTQQLSTFETSYCSDSDTHVRGKSL